MWAKGYDYIANPMTFIGEKEKFVKVPLVGNSKLVSQDACKDAKD